MEMHGSKPVYVSAGDLSRVPPFALGTLSVDPPTRSISSGERRAVLEPRVMQVLVALGLDPGQVLSRDDLIALCWDGRIVGDNAINRVISLLRHALAEVAQGTVRLETITKVGFRLVESADGPVTGADPSAPGRETISRVGRRSFIAAGGAAACLAVAGLAIWTRKSPIDPQAVDLYRRGQLTQRTGEPGTMDQAMTNYRRAVEIAPDYADAWGALAIGYYHAANGFSRKDRAAYGELMQSAARRALELDPGQPDAATALVLSRGFYGRELEAERDLRRLLEDHPDYWYANAQMGIFLRGLGRIRESIPYTRKTLRIDPNLPVGWGKLAIALVQSGDIQQADIALDEAGRKWPSNGALWFSHYVALMQTKRYEEAAWFVSNPATLPGYMPRQFVVLLSHAAEATRDGGSKAKRATQSINEMIAEDITNTPFAAPLLASLGARSDALIALERYYPDGARSPAPLTPIETEPLFLPSMLALRGEAAFTRLLQRTGLEKYSADSGSQPDFRRS